MSKIPDKNTTTYRYYDYDTISRTQVLKDLYTTECNMVILNREHPNRVHSEPVFWLNDIAYTITRTHKLALDRPTFTISIPVEKLGLDRLTTAAADYCLRAIRPYFEKINAEYANRSRPDQDNGKFYVYDPGPTVLHRNAAYFAEIPAKYYEDGKGNTIYVNADIDPPPDRMCLNIRIEVQLPRLKLDRAKTMLCKQLPDAAERFIRDFDTQALEAAYKLEQTQQSIRAHLHQSGYSAFIANGSILARERGTSAPMKNALPFQSPPGDEIEVAGIRGMGIKCGVTVITGGGYSGKSTVLNAISAGIYNHIAGDGRELCVTHDSAATITAEDGRAVSYLNISPFIKWIPGGDPAVFSTTHASGSTSQAANIMEAVDAGSKLLLIDEDRSATNFMIRDATMKALIKKEPITPFTDRVRELAKMGTSTILVIGGSGEYLGVADKVYMMDDFVMSDVTDKAHGMVNQSRNIIDEKLDSTRLCEERSDEAPPQANWQTSRNLAQSSLTSYPEGSGREKLSISDTGFIVIGDERIDIRNLHDIATPAQVNALAFMLRHMSKVTESLSDIERLALAMRGLEPKKAPGDTFGNNKKPIHGVVNALEWVQNLYAQIEKDSLNLVDTGFFTTMERFMDLPRPFELMAAICRMRKVEWVVT